MYRSRLLFSNRYFPMSKNTQSLKTAKKNLWQPLSDEQTEVIKGGGFASGSYLYKSNGVFCIQTGRLLYTR